MALSTDKAYLLGKAYALGIKHGKQSRLGMDEEPDHWITSHGNKIPVDKDGNPLNETGKIVLGKKEPPKKQTKAKTKSGSKKSKTESVEKGNKTSTKETKGASATPKSGNAKVDAYVERAQNPESDYIYEVKDMSDQELKDIYNFTKKHKDSTDDNGIILAYSAVEGELGNRARKQGKSFNDEWSRMVRGEVGLNKDKPQNNQSKDKPQNQSQPQSKADEQYDFFMKNFSNATPKELANFEKMASGLRDEDKKAGYLKAISELKAKQSAS